VPKTAARVTQADISRAIRAFVAAGIPRERLRVRIGAEGAIVEPMDAAVNDDAQESDLDQWMRKHGQI